MKQKFNKFLFSGQSLKSPNITINNAHRFLEYCSFGREHTLPDLK
jgi:hypothetical protein